MTFPRHDDLLVNDDVTFENSRWQLFQWLIGLDDKELFDRSMRNDTKFLGIVSWTLAFLLRVSQKYHILSQRSQEK